MEKIDRHYNSPARRSWIISALMVCFLGISSVLHPQFIKEDEQDEAADSRKGEEAPRKGDAVSKCSARNIRAVLHPDIKHAILVSWDADSGCKDDFIVGRADAAIDTEEKAFGARFIALVPAGTSNMVVDELLFPGRYYYVILSREKVRSRDVELVRNQNYTAAPVIVGKEKGFSSEVTDLRARKIDNRKVLVTWKRMSADRITYTLYRNSAQIATEQVLRSSERIGSITDGEEYIDTSFPLNGSYYYAITTRAFEGTESVSLKPDVTYTTYPVTLSGEEEGIPVHDLRARIEGKNVRLAWDVVPPKNGKIIREFAIHRGESAIDTPARLEKAWHLGSVDAAVREYNDVNPGAGAHYYAVTAKYTDGSEDWRLVPDANYTRTPMDLRGNYRVSSIEARCLGDRKKIEVLWTFNGSAGERSFRLFRTERKPRRLEELDEADVLKTVDVDRGYFLDESPRGKRYYGLAPLPGSAERDFVFIEGVSITTAPVGCGGSASIAEGEPGSPEEGEEQAIRKKTPPDFSSVDVVLKRTFFARRYDQAVKELQYLINYSDNDPEVAKARLFMGRSYVELRRYSRALEFLVLPDVRRYFPDEAKFWSDFAMVRVRER